MVAASELSINTNATADQMAEAMFGSGIEIVGASYTGAGGASGIYSGGDTTAPQLTPSDTGVILSTGRATDVTNSSGDANTSSGTSTNWNLAGDSDLNAIAGAQTFDAAIFEATFIPQGDVLTMQVVFSSEEYLEYVNSGFNDAVGIWVNGVKAELTVGDGDITINNINDQSNQNLYIDNPAGLDPVNTEMDGLTITLTLKANVTAGEENTIKIAIADGGDGVYDSNLLIAGDSIQTALVAGDDAVTLDHTQPQVVDVLANDNSTVPGTLTITAINGTPVVAGQTVTLPTGEMVMLNADGTFTITSDGEEGTNQFSYEVTDAAGNTDTAFVSLTTVPCFVAGTLIKTVSGDVPVERLRPGDRVITRDHGPQALRWLGMSRRKAEGKDAPVVFEAGALGQHEEVAVSANHRMLLVSARAALLFGEREVLVKAKHLVNGQSVRVQEDGAQVTYVHLLFDRHEIIWANGAQSESYHPGRETMESFDPETRAEILRLMPTSDALTGYGYGPSARVSLRGYESRALFG
ncbi:choice-of-anchor L domain-containing protein [Pseudoruegeria sp. SHC-113]|uniref:choice-of-anchor L domain-containing protein n=1 Tax=Pseudoruegeria sp. SHC-113 TaxID=2855439 RepID=UPI0021BB8764|nr:choice-of-anchor L domain-containing protein [Pseudoruegeria sp. SHC-113]MCT8158784.1 choice-of-anchor L domain-containing protein [Pseudoruegeria sp. SHC-113]